MHTAQVMQVEAGVVVVVVVGKGWWLVLVLMARTTCTRVTLTLGGVGCVHRLRTVGTVGFPKDKMIVSIATFIALSPFIGQNTLITLPKCVNDLAFVPNVPLAAAAASSIYIARSLELVVGKYKLLEYGSIAWGISTVVLIGLFYLLGVSHSAQGPINLVAFLLAWYERQVPKKSYIIMGKYAVPTSIINWISLLLMSNRDSLLQIAVGAILGAAYPSL